MNVEKKSPGQQKVDEYIERIKNGESADEIMSGLPPSFRSAIESGLSDVEETGEKQKEKETKSVEEAYLEDFEIIPPQYEGLSSDVLDEIWVVKEYSDPEKTRLEKLRKARAIEFLKKKEVNDNEEINSETKANETRAALGIPEIKAEGDNSKALAKLKELLNKKAAKYETTRPKLAEDIKNLAEQHKDSRHMIAENIMSLAYGNLRSADYKSKDSAKYQEVWDYASTDGSLPHRLESGWIYRGNMPSSGKKTENRGSLNVELSKDVINQIDSLISSGVIDANYKFGDPEGQTAATERHDAITIYFLTEPDEKALAALSEIAKKNLRGNELLGRKITDGFYMSEIGSVSDKHAKELIDKFQNIDPDLAKALSGFLTSATTGKSRVAMSEAQVYAIKEALDKFDYDIKYDTNNGFEIIKK